MTSFHFYDNRCEPSSSVLRNLLAYCLQASQLISVYFRFYSFTTIILHYQRRGSFMEQHRVARSLLLSGAALPSSKLCYCAWTLRLSDEWSNGRVLFFSSLEWRVTYGHVHMSFNLILFSGLSNTCVTTKMKSKNQIHKNLIFSGLLLSTITGKLIQYIQYMSETSTISPNHKRNT